MLSQSKTLESLKQALPLVDEAVLLDCVDIINAARLIKIVEHQDIDFDDSDFISSLIKSNTKFTEYDSIYEAIFKMAGECRERSRGGAILHKVLISEELYTEKVKTRLEDNENPIVKIHGIRIQKASEAVYNGDIVGLCRPKFKYISPEMLVIFGRITNGSTSSKT